MTKQLSALVLLLAMGGFSASVFAATNQGLSKQELDEINASCREESQGAENPQWYADECVDERIQALKEERGLAQPEEKEES